jgi:ectoine hydroxylase-related dioxygenase (phytanoyl-CoA dioxygenase family)
MIRPRPTFATDGFEIRHGILDTRQVAAIKAEIRVDHEVLRRTGIRNLEKKFSSIAEAAADPAVVSIAKSLLDATPKLVRALFFDKTDERNWSVPWHQDRTVTLNQRIDMRGWVAWTLKDGVYHVHPPVRVLEQMVTIRLHVDDADSRSGCLSVIRGSHRLGILTPEAIGEAVVNAQPEDCVIGAGDALIMHPLLLHSSARSTGPGHRRVVHLEYSSYQLPVGLAWA